MGIDQVKQPALYKTLAKAVRKQDHEELARMLSLVPESAYGQKFVERVRRAPASKSVPLAADSAGFRLLARFSAAP